MKVYVIAAVAQNRAIGYQNQLLYWLPNDLKNFKSLTSGHTIIMGRNTFESLPKGALPNRKNVVLTQQNITLEGCEVYHSLDELILTEVNDVPEHADTFFPDYQEWKEKSREHHEKDEKHAFDFDFVHYVKA